MRGFRNFLRRVELIGLTGFLVSLLCSCDIGNSSNDKGGSDIGDSLSIDDNVSSNSITTVEIKIPYREAITSIETSGDAWTSIWSACRAKVDGRVLRVLSTDSPLINITKDSIYSAVVEKTIFPLWVMTNDEEVVCNVQFLDIYGPTMSIKEGSKWCKWERSWGLWSAIDEYSTLDAAVTDYLQDIVIIDDIEDTYNFSLIVEDQSDGLELEWVYYRENFIDSSGNERVDYKKTGAAVYTGPENMRGDIFKSVLSNECKVKIIYDMQGHRVGVEAVE